MRSQKTRATLRPELHTVQGVLEARVGAQALSKSKAQGSSGFRCGCVSPRWPMGATLIASTTLVVII